MEEVAFESDINRYGRNSIGKIWGEISGVGESHEQNHRDKRVQCVLGHRE